MAFELHVWGAAFGLDSIDAECLATITCLRCVVPVQDWTLVPSNDTTVSPDHILPALLHQGTWTSGYMNIISYLRQHFASLTSQLADHDLTPPQSADLLAYSSYLASRGSGLIALSLYASPNAWAEVTQPAYGTLLPFPLTWTIPMSLHAAAVEKAEHLGMANLAIQAESEQVASAIENTSTGFMRLREQLGPRRSLQPEQTSAIRFNRLADDFFTTLDNLLEENQNLLGTDRPSSLDFLAYGYLSLMAVKTPFPLLSDALKAKDRPSFLFLQTMKNEAQKYATPNIEQRPRRTIRTLGTFADNTIENIVGVGDSWKRWRRGGIKPYGEDNVQDPAQLLITVGGVVVGLAALGAAALFRASMPFGAPTHRFERPQEEKGLLRFGEAGKFFQGLPGFDEPPVVRDTVYHNQTVDVAVDVAPSSVSNA